MNKRFRELAKQAGIDFFNCTNPEHGDREYCEAWTEPQQKFAELIVKECIEISHVGSSTEDKIKKHFGVEE